MYYVVVKGSSILQMTELLMVMVLNSMMSGPLVVLNRLKEVGLTMNGDKCEFRLTRLTFFGHQVTQNGVEPSEEKVAAIRNTDPPQNAIEAQSFLGLAKFVSKLIPDQCPLLQSLSRD